MRGFISPSIKATPSETQNSFRAYTRGRRSKLAKTAQTTLLKADQWARGDSTGADVSEALERAVQALVAKTKKS